MATNVTISSKFSWLEDKGFPLSQIGRLKNDGKEKNQKGGSGIGKAG
jgi:hypothetical protein